MPNGSYTDGHTKTVAAESISRIFPMGSMSLTQNTPERSRASSATPADTSAAISGVSGAPAHSTNCTSGPKRCAAASRWATPFCLVIRPTNATIGRPRSDAEVGKHGLPREGSQRLGRVPHLGVDPVAHDMHPAGIQRRIDPQHVIAHTRADGDNGVRGRHRSLFYPRRDPIAATELFCLPRPQRLQRVRGQHMRDVVEQCGQLPRQSGVPGVGVDHAGLGGGIGHHQIGRQRRKRRVRAAQLRVGLVGERVRPGGAHAMHVNLAQFAQLRDELGYVHPRAAVHLRRILPSHHRHPHTRHGSSRFRIAPSPG